jgi:hypothetical protein
MSRGVFERRFTIDTALSSAVVRERLEETTRPERTLHDYPGRNVTGSHSGSVSEDSFYLIQPGFLDSPGCECRGRIGLGSDGSTTLWIEAKPTARGKTFYISLMVLSLILAFLPLMSTENLGAWRYLLSVVFLTSIAIWPRSARRSVRDYERFLRVLLEDRSLPPATSS